MNDRQSALDGIAEKLLSELDVLGGNGVISPSCLYQALALLAHMTDGEAHDELASALGGPVEMGDTLASLASLKSSQNESYEETLDYITGASLWIDSSVSLKPSFERRFGAGSRIDIEQMQLRSQQAQKAMGKWLSRHTGGVYKQAPGVPDASKLVALSALYLKDSWTEAFEEEDDRHFRCDDGYVAEVPFMVSYEGRSVLDRDGSITTDQILNSGARLIISMPAEGTSLTDYISSGQAWQSICQFATGDSIDYVDSCELHMPPFTISSDGVDVASLVQNLGITRIFEAGEHFAPLTSELLEVDGIIQNTRLEANEEGLEGASFVEILMCTGLPPINPPEPRKIFFNRPFALAVVSPENHPLFVGLFREP